MDRGIKVRTSGLYALMGWQELSYLTLPRLVLILGLLALPLVMPSMYWQRVVTIVCIYALLAMSFDLLAHFVGLVSLGGAFFIGTGGYLSAILNTSFGLPPSLSIPIAALLGAVICTILLLPCLPLRGVYFAIITLMYPLALARVIEATDILGGTDGIMGIDSFSNAWVEQYFVILVVLLILFGVRRLVETDMGLVVRAVKDNDQAVRASGMNVNLYKAGAVFIASGMGCLGGACLVHFYMWAAFPVMSLPLKMILPEVGLTNPVIQLTMVVLPEPFGPMMPNTSPSFKWKLTRFKARMPPKVLVNSLISRTG